MQKLKAGLNKQRVIGIGYVLSASFCFGMMPAATQLAFASGLSVETLLATRFPLGLLITWGYIFKKKLNYKLDKKGHLFVMALGILYISFASCVNQSYLYLPGAVSSILVFLYISIVVALEIAIGREKLNPTKIICVIMSMGGLILVIGNPFGQSGLSIVGILLGLCGGALYAVYATGLGARTAKNLDPIIITGYVLIYPSLFNIARCLLSGESLILFKAEQFVIIAALGLFSTFLGNLYFCKGIRIIGSSNAAVINTIEPVVAYFAGMFIMGDQLGIQAVLGGVIIIISIIFLNISDSRAEDRASESSSEDRASDSSSETL